jgi:hypothetical protein
LARQPAEAALETVRQAARLPEKLEGFAWPVRRLDRPGEAYWLVTLGPAGAVEAVAAVDAAGGTILSMTRLVPPRPFELLSAAEAARRTGVSHARAVGLAWAPCQASYSPLYPFWVVQAGEKLIYVSQQGQTWNRIESGPG